MAARRASTAANRAEVIGKPSRRATDFKDVSFCFAAADKTGISVTSLKIKQNYNCCLQNEDKVLSAGHMDTW